MEIEKNETIIKLEDVWKSYSLGRIEVPALQAISLEIEKGSFTGIVGPSGSGKSTFLNIIGCLDVPTRGRVFLDNLDISLLSENALAQIRGRKIGFVFQQFNLLQNLSAMENVALPMAFLAVPEEKRKERARLLLTIVGLGTRMKHKPGELSGGEQQRVAIARALVNDPEVIVADEPTGNLDSKTGALIIELLVRLHQNEKKTIIIVTHDMDVARFADRIVHLKDGQIENSPLIPDDRQE